MALDDLAELLDVLFSWRFYLGVAITSGLCWLCWRFIPHEPLALGVCVPIAIAGFVLSWRWQANAESR